MEQNRYHQNHPMYILGMVFLVLSLALFAFVFYSIPYLLLKWRYDVPEFLVSWVHGLAYDHHLTESGAGWLLMTLLLVVAGVIARIASLISNHIDSKLYQTENSEELTSKPPTETSPQTRETWGMVFKIALIVLFVFLGTFVFEWLIYIPPQ